MKRTRLRARAATCLLFLGLVAAATFAAGRSAASVSIAVSWEALLARSTAAAFVTPVEATVVWENGRIFTYTHVNVDQALAGSLKTGADAWVRTLGGIAGNVGQRVEGEAVLSPGSPSLLFLRDGPAGAFDVTARGQGQFSVRSDSEGVARVVRNRAAGMLVPPALPAPQVAPPLATDVLEGLSVEDATQRVAAAWTQFHAH